MTAPASPLSNWMDDELKRKLTFTAFAILIYRVGAHIVAPGVDLAVLQQAIQSTGAASLFQLYDTLGGGLSRATIFALGIMPYISASIVFQLGGALFPRVAKMQRDEDGKKKLTQWTRYLTIAIAGAQAATFSTFVSSQLGALAPGWGPRFVMAFTLTVGAIFVMWLGEQITERGIGNGMSLLIAVSIIERLWPSSFQLLQTVGDEGGMSYGALLALIVVAVLSVAAVVGMTIAARRLPIQIPRKVMGRGRVREGQKTFIPIRLITAGVMPIVFAQTIIIMPSTLLRMFRPQATGTMADVVSYFEPGTFVYETIFAVMVVLFSYFYTAIIFNSVDLSENLKKQGGFIPGVRPGTATADYIDHVLGRITFPGAIFLALISIVPTIIARAMGTTMVNFGGTSILIVVGVLLDTIGQIEQHRTLRKYDSFMKTGRVKFRGRQQRYI